jgi:hypothetical protein
MERLIELIDKTTYLHSYIIDQDIHYIDNRVTSKDTRSITYNYLAHVVEASLVGLILSKNLFNLEYIKKEINSNIDEDYLPELQNTYDASIKNALFNDSFIAIECHIRSIASYLGNNILQTSISQTFTNLKDIGKTNVFTNINQDDQNLFSFYCYLRNTMHNCGFQNRNHQEIILSDQNSIINKSTVKLELNSNSGNMMTHMEILLLIEQIVKLIKKIDSVLDNNVYIQHPLSEIYN